MLARQRSCVLTFHRDLIVFRNFSVAAGICALLLLLVSPGSAHALSVTFNRVGCAQPCTVNPSAGGLSAIAFDDARGQVVSGEGAEGAQLPIFVFSTKAELPGVDVPRI